MIARAKKVVYMVSGTIKTLIEWLNEERRKDRDDRK
jgi:hypothetical protein